MRRLRLVHKRKPYKGPSCGAEIPDLPMTVLKHQMSHVRRRPFADDRRKPGEPHREHIPERQDTTE